MGLIYQTNGTLWVISTERENVLLGPAYLEGFVRLRNQGLADGGEVSPYEDVLLLPATVVTWLRLSCLERYWETLGRALETGLAQPQL
jgi:hypothetical protein